MNDTIFVLLIQRWKGLAISGVLFGVAGILYTYLSPTLWRAQADLMLTMPTGSSAMPLSNGPTPLTIVGGMFQSRFVQAELNKKAKVPWSLAPITVSVDEKSERNTIQIGANDANKAKAIKKLQIALDAVQVLQRRFNNALASKQAGELEKAIQTKTVELQRAEQDLLDLEKSGIMPIKLDAGDMAQLVVTAKGVEIDLQAADTELKGQLEMIQKSVANGASAPTPLGVPEEMRRKLQDAQLALVKEKITAGDLAPSVVRLQKEVEAAKAEIEAELGRTEIAAQSNLEPNVFRLALRKEVLTSQASAYRKLLGTMPQDSVRVSRKIREVETYSTILAQLRRDYELKKVNAVSDQVVFDVLEAPYVLDEPVNKTYGKNAVLFGVLGVVVYVLVILYGTYFKRERQPRSPKKNQGETAPPQ
jgi:uncharacterized protein involved in exopolysaccharide biosynthesis